MQLHKAGNCVDFDGKLIPALNIQVEGVPGYLEHTDKSKYWYGIYFEVMFEDGSYWVVEKGCRELDTEEIVVAEYRDLWPRSTRETREPSYAWLAFDWNHFLEVYDIKVRVRSA
jgi:hypothetical protein